MNLHLNCAAWNILDALEDSAEIKRDQKAADLLLNVRVAFARLQEHFKPIQEAA